MGWVGKGHGKNIQGSKEEGLSTYVWTYVCVHVWVCISLALPWDCMGKAEAA